MNLFQEVQDLHKKYMEEFNKRQQEILDRAEKSGNLKAYVIKHAKDNNRKMEPGFYMRENGSFFEITDNNKLVEHGS